MRLNINLASQPYQDARTFALRWAGILGALLLLAIALSYAVYSRWHSYRDVSASIEREKSILAEYDAKQQQDLAILNKPENQDVRQRSVFLNDLIRRKQVSWTKIFTDLEGLMPSRLRVVAIEPAVVEDQVLLNMQVGGDSRERAAELVRRMETSRTFKDARVVREVQQEAGTGGRDPLEFEITAEYTPVTTNTTTASAGAKPQEGGQ